MRRLPLLAGLIALAGLSVARAETPPAAPAPAARPASAPAPSRTAEIKGPTGAVVGHVSLWDTPGGVLIRLDVSGLAPGWHGLHLHQTADCTGPAFTGAGSHMHAAQAGTHGFLSASGPEAGDLPNLFVGQDGHGSAEVFTARVRMAADGDLPAVLDADGSALVIHAAADDQFTQPTGGSGARIACAVLR